MIHKPVFSQLIQDPKATLAAADTVADCDQLMLVVAKGWAALGPQDKETAIAAQLYVQLRALRKKLATTPPEPTPTPEPMLPVTGEGWKAIYTALKGGGMFSLSLAQLLVPMSKPQQPLTYEEAVSRVINLMMVRVSAGLSKMPDYTVLDDTQKKLLHAEIQKTLDFKRKIIQVGSLAKSFEDLYAVLKGKPELAQQKLTAFDNKKKKTKLKTKGKGKLAHWVTLGKCAVVIPPGYPANVCGRVLNIFSSGVIDALNPTLAQYEKEFTDVGMTPPTDLVLRNILTDVLLKGKGGSLTIGSSPALLGPYEKTNARLCLQSETITGK